LRKLDADYEAHDSPRAMAFLQKHAAKGQVVTGCSMSIRGGDLHAHLDTVETPLNQLDERRLSRLRRAGQVQRQPALGCEHRKDLPMDVVPLGPGFAAELRGVTLADVASDDAAYAACGPPSRSIPFWCFAART